MTRLTLIRHGQTPSNVLGLLDTGAPGPGLTELGQQQAAAIPPLLADVPIDAVYVSKLVRTHVTALPLASSRAIERFELPGIHEVEAGSLEMRGDDDAVRAYMSTAFAWGSGDLDARIPDGPDGHVVVREEVQAPEVEAHGRPRRGAGWATVHATAAKACPGQRAEVDALDLA